jgi:cytochrome c556
MNPELKTSYRSEEAEKAWFETYEFLEGQVEAAAEKFAVASTAAPIAEEKHAATIAELMRVINAPTGVRGDLARLLADKPANAGIWKQVRAHAVVMTETGTRLQSHIPTRGKRTSWRKYAGEYRNLAASLVAAADRRDYGSVQKLLGRIADSCGACHLEHR